MRAEARLSLVVEDKALGLLIEVVGQHIGTQAIPDLNEHFAFDRTRAAVGTGLAASPVLPGRSRFRVSRGKGGTLRSPLCAFLV